MQNNTTKLSKLQTYVLLALRMGIGWHFLYEGVSKMLIPDWTSAPYLENSRWLFADFFHWIAANATVLSVVDWMNMIGLTLAGLALMTGLLTRLACSAGILLLLLYYVANPPFVRVDFGLPSEGHYIFVNKNLVEMMALLAIAVFPAHLLPGLHRLLKFPKAKRLRPPKENKTEEIAAPQGDRREWLKNLVSLPFLGAFAYGSVKKYQWESINAITGATIQAGGLDLKDLKGVLPKGKIGNFEISRLFMGGNLVGGWAHARDLRYASKLFKSYNTEKKVFETLELAEKAGINTMNTTSSQIQLINKYKRVTGSKLQTTCQVHVLEDNIYDDINLAIDRGTDMIQLQGARVDYLVNHKRVDIVQKAIDHTRSQGYLAGLGAHAIQAIMDCDKAGIEPDFYMKTLHHDQYWSAHPKENRIPYSVDGERSSNHNEFHDNMYCLFPDESIEFMKKKKIPWIGFKVLAAGAIHPSDGFQFAFENGADFICVGMFDWQIVEDVNITIDVLSHLQHRERSWMG